MGLKTSKSKSDISAEQQQIQEKIINNSKSGIANAAPVTTNKRTASKKRMYQEKKMLYMDDDLHRLWTQYVSQELLKGNKVVYQSIADKLLRDFLLRNIKSNKD